MIDHSKDQLAEDASVALAAGLSYGKYKALQKENMLPTIEKADTNVPIGPLCLICGQPMPVAGSRRKYCGPVCADIAYRNQLREREKGRRKK